MDTLRNAAEACEHAAAEIRVHQVPLPPSESSISEYQDQFTSPSCSAMTSSDTDSVHYRSKRMLDVDIPPYPTPAYPPLRRASSSLSLIDPGLLPALNSVSPQYPFARGPVSAMSPLHQYHSTHRGSISSFGSNPLSTPSGASQMSRKFSFPLLPSQGSSNSLLSQSDHGLPPRSSRHSVFSSLSAGLAFFQNADEMILPPIPSTPSAPFSDLYSPGHHPQSPPACPADSSFLLNRPPSPHTTLSQSIPANQTQYIASNSAPVSTLNTHNSNG